MGSVKRMSEIGSIIKRLREEHGMTQEALAERLCLSRQAVSNYERGKTKPDVTILASLAEIFEVPIEDLLETEERTPEDGIRKRKALTHLALAGASGLLCLLIHSVSILLYRNGKDTLFLISVGLLRPALLFRMGMETTCVLFRIAKRRAIKRRRRRWLLLPIGVILAFMICALFVGALTVFQTILPQVASFATWIIRAAPWLNAFVYVNYYGWPVYIPLGIVMQWLLTLSRKKKGG